MINILIESVRFTITILLVAIVPGLLLINRLNLKLDLKEKLTCSVIVGLCLTTLLSYILGYFNLRSLFAPILLILIVVFILKNKKFYKKNFNLSKIFNINSLLLTVIIIVGIIGQTSKLVGSGVISQSGGLEFTEYRDAIWHIALVGELAKNVPPLHPGFSPEPLSNYHYFYDLFVSNIFNLSDIPILDLSYRFVPIFLSMFFGLSIYILVKKISNQNTALLAVFLAYFTGNFSYFAKALLTTLSDWGPSTFWIDQTFSMLINPPLSISFIILLVGAYLLLETIKNKSLSLIIVTSILFGSLISYKVYGGLLVLFALFVCGAYELIIYRKLTIIKIFIVSTILSLILFIPTNGKEAGSFLVFAPLWYLKSMIENNDRLNLIDWSLREATYVYEKNYLRVLELKLVEFVIYLVGNFGIRVISLVGLLFILAKKLKINTVSLFLITVGATGFVLPLFFIQRGSVANTIQFSYYSLLIASIATAGVVYKLMRDLPRKFKLIVLTLIILLAIPTSIKTFIETIFPKNKVVIAREEILAIDYLKKTKDDSVILLPVTKRNTDAMYISALTSRRTFYSDKLMSENTQKDFAKREYIINEFFSSNDIYSQNTFLKTNNISYVYYYVEDSPNFKPDNPALKLIYQTDKIRLLGVNL